MKNILLYTLIIVTLGSCAVGISGNGKVTEEKRKLIGFTQLDVGGGFEIILKQGDQYEVVVRADENLHDHIKTSLNGNKLVISTNGSIRRAEAMELYITAPEFTEFDFSGAIELKNKGILKGKTLELDCSGASEIDLNLDYKKIDSEFSGASEVELKGEVDKIRIDASGASELNFLELEAEELSLESSGACEAQLYVTKRLAIEASGASEISYKGNPTIEKSDLSGAASIKSINE